MKNYEHIFKHEEKMCFGDYVIVITVTILHSAMDVNGFPFVRLFVCLV